MGNEMMVATFWWLRLLGMRPHAPTKWSNLWNGVLIFGLTYSTILVAMAWEDDFDVIVEVLDTFLPFVESVVKSLLIVVKRDDLKRILRIVDKLQQERDIATHHLTRRFFEVTRRALVLMRITYISGVVLMLLRAVLSHEKEMPYRIWVPSDWHTSQEWTAFHFMYFGLQTFLGFVLIFTIATIDSLYITLVAHLVGHITIINEEFRMMFQNPRVRKHRMVNIVKRQNLTFTCLDLINDVFSVQMLVQLAVIVVTICMGLVIISDKGFATITTFIQLFMMSSSTLEAFIYCFFGNMVADKLYETRNYIFSSEWYLCPQQAKDVIILMQRANVVRIFTFGGLLNLDLETFSLIMKNSFSFYALLQASKPQN